MHLRTETAAIAIATAVLARSLAAQRPADTAPARPAISRTLAPDRLPERGVGDRGVANTIDVIDSAEIADAHAESLSDLLRARRPGLSVLRSSGALSSASRVRMRGPSSVAMSTDPLVFVDGVQVVAQQEAGGSDATITTSRLDDIAPEDVARIELLRGAAAATRFGAGSSNGVIAITTKRGAPGARRFSGGTEAGVVMQRGDFPDNVRRGGSVASCTLALEATGGCTPGELVRFNPLQRYTPFRTGRLVTASAALTGGLLGTSAYIGGTLRGDGGVTSSDTRDRRSLRVTIGRTLFSQLDLEAGFNGTWRKAMLPPNGNQLSSDNKLLRGLLGSATDDGNQGYFTLGGLSPAAAEELGEHRAASLAARWRPAEWARAGLVVGSDRGSSRDRTPFDSPFGPGREDIEGTDAIKSVVSFLGLSYEAIGAHAETGAGFRHTSARGERRSSVVAGTVSSFSEITADARTSAAWLRQSFAWRDRTAVDASITRVTSDGLGSGLGGTWLAALAGSWSAWRSEAHSLVVDARYGEGIGDESVAPLALVSGGVSLPSPSRERMREVELGATGVLGPMVTLVVTGYQAKSSRLLVPVNVPGTGFGTAFINAASMRTTGVEALARLHLLDTGPVRWDASVSATAMRNRVTSLGGTPPQISLVSQVREGYPVESVWTRPYAFSDANGDGLIAPGEVTLGSSTEYAGSSFPTREVSLRSRVARRRLALDVALDYRGDFRVVDANHLQRCTGSENCSEIYDRRTSLADQAEAVAAGNSSADAGYREDGSFLKLRELALTWTASSTFRVSVIGRDLATVTRYPGLDPETTAFPVTGPRIDIGTLPVTRRVVVRLDVTP